jgi:ATP-dependent Clp protease ATP-binding subunit ClpB
VAREGFDPVYGARPLRRFLQQQLETRVGRALIAGEAGEGSLVRVDLEEGSLAVRIEEGGAPEVPPASETDGEPEAARA